MDYLHAINSIEDAITLDLISTVQSDEDRATIAYLGSLPVESYHLQTPSLEIIMQSKILDDARIVANKALEPFSITVNDIHQIREYLRIEMPRYQGTVTFDVMSTLSEAFHTKSIDIGTEQYDDGGYDTCSDPYSLITLTLKDWYI